MITRNVNVNIDQRRIGITPRDGMMDIAAYLVKQYSRDEGISRERALERIMETVVYEALMNEETEMYCEPKAAVYDMLLAEMEGHPEKMLEIWQCITGFVTGENADMINDAMPACEFKYHAGIGAVLSKKQKNDKTALD